MTKRPDEPRWISMLMATLALIAVSISTYTLVDAYQTALAAEVVNSE